MTYTDQQSISRLLDNCEDLVPVVAAVREVTGRRIATRTALRWCISGLAGPDSRVRLESMRVGSRRLTSTAAVRRFLGAVNAERAGPPATPGSVHHRRDAADQVLASFGLPRKGEA